ncbi:helix-turn-helix transcriptional regulator [Nodosilinea sp. LEGE 06152]|uniref:helix-turn-helix transcriptional regulator n=1 Tax=Nodosilinea sp. LEGE 06152 TaxID=2777966 RepID=UPI00187E58C1|nr:AraC family transcriptional regulator [Nodosilinea sp. LEGE 06152]MBE9156977.1 helix-turn-helix transcriptional regulator [Nodosilinea sp. LEGE 06152]
MSLVLTDQEVSALWAEAEQHCLLATSIDRLETIHTLPSSLGYGYCREIELCAGLDLTIFNETYSTNFTFRGVENRHLVQFMVHLSGVVDSGDFLYQDATQSYVGGSGIQRAVTNVHPANQPEVGVNIHLQPWLLSQLFAAPTGELPPELQPLVKGDDWQQVFSPSVTEAMRGVVQQIIDCPFLGVTKRLYLQGKVFELMALQLDGMVVQKPVESASSLKADTVARVHYAAEILRSQLETPPSLTDLAQQVGIGHCTLNKGFREIFGMTPFAYLTRQRMEQAKQLLRSPGCTVAEVANRVGYANPAQFAAAFKRHFGMTPRECMRGVINR